MQLTELDPRWLTRDGRRIGVAFHCPNPERRKWWLTCFSEPTEQEHQYDAVAAALGDTDMWVPCNETSGWTFAGGIAEATFDKLTITPSLNAGDHMWHGFVTNGICR